MDRCVVTLECYRYVTDDFTIIVELLVVIGQGEDGSTSTWPNIAARVYRGRFSVCYVIAVL